MAYINRLSNINNKLDINIENQIETNNTLTNIDDNAATLNANIKSSFDSTNNALKVNIVAGGFSSSSVDGKAYLYNGAGDKPITSTDVTSTKNGIDTASVMYVSDGTTRTALTSTAVTSTKNGIDTASAMYVSDGTTRTALTATSNALDVNIKTNTINRLGSANNILNGALNANTFSTSIDITGYNKCILSYQDSQSLTDAILIFGSLNNTDFFYIGAVLPVYYSSFTGGAKRFASTKLDLASIKYIKIYNSSTTNITTGNCTLVSA